MVRTSETSGLAILPRMRTGVPGLDEVLGGGLPANRTCLVAGAPGTGKTTLGNQLAFAHASAGRRAIVATLLVETHDVMLENLRGFQFFDPAIVGHRVQYVSLFNALEDGGLNGTVEAIRRAVRESDASLLVVDGTAVITDSAYATLDLRRFTQQLQVHAGLLGCTIVLLMSDEADEILPLGAHADGMVVLTNERVDARHIRKLEVLKLRGAAHVTGAHEFSITEAGMTVHPRLESIAGWRRPPEKPGAFLGTGVATLDAMIGGGLMPFSSTLVIGTPGAGKTLLGLNFLTAGARNGERGLMAGFHETATDLVQTAAGIGLDLGRHIDDGQIRLLWNPPLELSADEWAWQLLAAVEEHQPTRVFVDAITDAERLILSPVRIPTYIGALVNELRARGATTMISAEIDAYVDDQLAVPVPAASATMDNGILVRQVELRSSLHRMISVLKSRRTSTDPTIREFVIGDQGIVIGEPLRISSPGLLTGRAALDYVSDAGA